MKNQININYFNNDIEEFIKSASSSKEHIKSKYKELVKKYHPDLVAESCIELANTCISKLNYVFYKITTTNEILLQADNEIEYDDKKKKYKFVNEYGVEEYIKELSLVLFKNGLLEINTARNIIHDNPRFNNEFETINMKAIVHVYKGLEYLKRSLKIDEDSLWSDQVKIYIEYGNKLNARLASGISQGTIYNIVAL
jgi:hypothetical protein